MTADSNRFADVLMEPFEAAALRQRRAAQRQLRGVLPSEPARQETLGEIWNSPTPGSLFDIAQGIASGFRGAGRALSGGYAVQPETPGQWSEPDEFRAQHARRQMQSDASALAGAVTLGSLPRVLARGAIDPNALGAGSPPRRLSMDAESVAARADAMDRVFTGRSHLAAVEKAEAALGVPIDRLPLAPYPDGFVTTSGRYVSRHEAAEIASETGQLRRPPEAPGYMGLASEHTRMAGTPNPAASGGRTRRTENIGTSAPDLPGGGGGVWLRREPGDGTTALWSRAARPAQVDVQGATVPEIHSTLAAAWEHGHDAVWLKNYTPPGGASETVLVVRDAAQLRDPKARFDPAKINSRNVMATGAGLGLFAPLTFPLARTEHQSEPPAQ